MKLNKKIRKPFCLTAKTVKNNRLLAIDKIAQLEANLKGLEIEQEFLLKQISTIAEIEVDETLLYDENFFNTLRKNKKGFTSTKLLMLGSRYAILDGMKNNIQCSIYGWKGVERSLSEI